MRALLKEAEVGVLQPALDEPIPRNHEERSRQGGPELVGTLIGGIGGAGAGLMSSPDENPLRNMFIGGTAGGAAGRAIGSYIGNRRLLKNREEKREDMYNEAENRIKMEREGGSNPVRIWQEYKP